MEFPLMRSKLLRSLMVSLLMLFPFSVQADGGDDWFYNWLFGVSAGYASRTGSLLITNSYDTPFDDDLPNPPGVYARRDLSDSGAIAGAFIGYQGICHQWLKGIELSVDFQPISRAKSFAVSDPDYVIGYTGVMRYQRKWIGGLTARFGYAVTSCFMPYIRLGAELGSDRLTTSYSSLFILEGRVVTNEQRQWVYRFLLGVGVEFPLVKSCGTTLRLEYNYESKGRTLKTDTYMFDEGLNPRFKSETQPFTRVGRVAVVWNFY